MSNKNFQQIIKESYEKTSFSELSPLMKDREQLKMKSYEMNGKNLHISGVDYIEYTKNNEEHAHGVVTFTEYPDKFYFTGLKLSEWIKEMLSVAEKDELNAYLLENPVEVIFEIIQTKNNTMLDFSIVDEF